MPCGRWWYWRLLGLLVAQVTWFQFDRLSAIPELRPFYEKGCELAGCELKPLIDVEAIQSRKLVVRTDPDNRSQLLVDAVIINRAAFEQPFPAIALTFSNLNGDVVAQSTCSRPKSTWPAKAAELAAMPTNTPVRIAIGIRDPGRDAVNYNIAFREHSRQAIFTRQRWPTAIDSAKSQPESAKNNQLFRHLRPFNRSPPAVSLAPFGDRIGYLLNSRSSRICLTRCDTDSIMLPTAKIGPYTLPNPLIVAPMAGVTDRPFRLLMSGYGRGPGGVGDGHRRQQTVAYA